MSAPLDAKIRDRDPDDPSFAQPQPPRPGRSPGTRTTLRAMVALGLAFQSLAIER